MKRPDAAIVHADERTRYVDVSYPRGDLSDRHFAALTALIEKGHDIYRVGSSGPDTRRKGYNRFVLVLPEEGAVEYWRMMSEGVPADGTGA